MQALILAGGLGTRLNDMVRDRPKPLAPVAGRPFLSYQLEFLRAQRIQDVILCVGYRHEQVQRYVESCPIADVNIQLSVESEPLGTAGAIKNAARFVDGTFIVLNGDTFAEFELDALVQRHREVKSQYSATLGTLALTRVASADGYGAVQLGGDCRIVAFDEKKSQSVKECCVSAGIYVFEPEILSRIPPRTKTSLEFDVFPQLIAHERLLAGYISAGFFVDIGTPTGYYRFQHHMEESSC